MVFLKKRTDGQSDGDKSARVATNARAVSTCVRSNRRVLRDKWKLPGC